MRCIFFRFFLGSAMVLTLLSPLAKAQTPCPVCTTSSLGFDKESGFCLPSGVEGLTPVPMTAKDIEQDKVDGNVKRVIFTDKKHSTSVKAILMSRPKPSKAADAAYIRQIEQHYLTTYPGAKMPQTETGTMTLGGRDYPAYGRVFTWPDNGTQLISFLWVVPHKQRFFSIITQYLDPKTNQGEAMLRALDVQMSLADQICAVR
jgi:hypothetical protein